MKVKTSVEIERKLWIKFKVLCVKRNRNMGDVLEQIIGEWVKANE